MSIYECFIIKIKITKQAIIIIKLGRIVFHKDFSPFYFFSDKFDSLFFYIFFFFNA